MARGTGGPRNLEIATAAQRVEESAPGLDGEPRPTFPAAALATPVAANREAHFAWMAPAVGLLEQESVARSLANTVMWAKTRSAVAASVESPLERRMA